MLRETANGEDGNLWQVAHDLKEAREVLGAVEARALAGVAAILSEAADSLSRTAERLEKMAPQEWMTAEEAAAYVRRTPEAFHKLVLNEGVPRHRISGQRYLYSRLEIDAWIMGR